MKTFGRLFAAWIVAGLFIGTSATAQQGGRASRAATPRPGTAKPAARPKAPARPAPKAKPAPKPRPKVQKPAVKAKPKPGGGKQPKPGPPPAPFVAAPPLEIESRIIERIFDLTNAERAKFGLAPLRWDDRLGVAAQGHSANMYVTGVFDHEIDGIDHGDRIRAVGYNASAFSENIYMQFSVLSESEILLLADAAVVGWMNSPGHRANILDPAYTELGVGVVVLTGPDVGSTPGDVGWRGIYATQKFAMPSR